MKLFVGVDGGGTKTRTLVVAEDGTCLGAALTGASNPNSVGACKAHENLIDGLKSAVASVGTEAEFAAAFFGISGVNDSLTAKAFRRELAEDVRIKFAALEVENDTRSLCASAFGMQSGIVLIAGTGSKCYGRTEDGREWETGGYDFHVSDEASAFDLARRGLTAAVRAADGRGEPTLLKDILFKELQIVETGQVSQRLHQDSLKHPGVPMTKDEIAALAVHVGNAYLAGDAVAGKILKTAMADLVDMVEAVARKLGMPAESLRLGITGGVILNEPCATLFREAMFERFPQCEIFEPQEPPVVGAAIRALSLGGVKVTPEVLAKLSDSFKAL